LGIDFRYKLILVSRQAHKYKIQLESGNNGCLQGRGMSGWDIEEEILGFII
jgi:hypothetical protein